MSMRERLLLTRTFLSFRTVSGQSGRPLAVREFVPTVLEQCRSDW